MSNAKYVPTEREQAFLDSVENPRYERESINGLSPFLNEKAPEDVLSFYSKEELETVRGWLSGKAVSIYGGSFEIQNNIIAKNILGLPETTQKG